MEKNYKVKKEERSKSFKRMFQVKNIKLYIFMTFSFVIGLTLLGHVVDTILVDALANSEIKFFGNVFQEMFAVFGKTFFGNIVSDVMQQQNLVKAIFTDVLFGCFVVLQQKIRSTFTAVLFTNALYNFKNILLNNNAEYFENNSASSASFAANAADSFGSIVNVLANTVGICVTMIYILYRIFSVTHSWFFTIKIIIFIVIDAVLLMLILQKFKECNRLVYAGKKKEMHY